MNKENLMIHDIKIVISQDNDTCQNSDVYQELTIELVDNGAGHFLRLNSGEHGWSLDDLKDLKNQISNVRNKINKIFDSVLE